LILNLALPDQPCEDFPAWHYEWNGKFSVKSAYKLAYNILHGVRWQAGNSEAVENTRNIWSVIWKDDKLPCLNWGKILWACNHPSLVATNTCKIKWDKHNIQK
jgi:hypothetical protein